MAAKAEQAGPAKLDSSGWCVAFTPDEKSFVAGTHAGPRLVAVPEPKLLPPPVPSPEPASPVPGS